MKKKKVHRLRLAKKSISNLTTQKIGGLRQQESQPGGATCLICPTYATLCPKCPSSPTNCEM
jgi:hypothetical protein